MFLSLVQDIPLNQAVPLEQYDREWCLVNNDSELSLVSNICPHQNAMLTDVPTSKFTCGYHGKQFSINGTGTNTSLCLPKKPVYITNALILDKPLPIPFPCNLAHMKLAEYRKDIVYSTPEIIMDVFLDIEHIDHAHAGVYDQIGIDDLGQVKVGTFEYCSTQSVLSDNPTYAINADREAGLAAYWLAIYPATMIEWQPGSCFVTVATKANDSSSCVHVFKYYDDRYDANTISINDKIWETAWSQDKHLSESIVSLPTRYLSELKQHYADWLKNAK